MKKYIIDGIDRSDIDLSDITTFIKKSKSKVVNIFDDEVEVIDYNFICYCKNIDLTLDCARLKKTYNFICECKNINLTLDCPRLEITSSYICYCVDVKIFLLSSTPYLEDKSDKIIKPFNFNDFIL